MKKGTDDNEMWEWYCATLPQLVKRLHCYKFLASKTDDVTQEALEYLITNEDLARSIFSGKNKTYLIKLLKTKAKEVLTQDMFGSYNFGFYYAKIKKLSDEYGIEIKVSNAYLFVELLNDPHFSYYNVIQTIQMYKTCVEDCAVRININEVMEQDYE